MLTVTESVLSTIYYDLWYFLHAFINVLFSFQQMRQYAFLDGLVTMATATIHQKDIVLPQALIDTAALLHGNVTVHLWDWY